MEKLLWIPHSQCEWVLAEESTTGEARATSRSLALTLGRASASSTSELLSSATASTIENSRRFDASHLDDEIDNLLDVRFVHEGACLHQLRRRWFLGKIFTFASDVLFLVNPYKEISGLYDDPSLYLNAKNKRPHVYSIANAALANIINFEDESSHRQSHNQTIIISGESGAGKTEASKSIIKFLTFANDKNANSEASRIKSKLAESNIIFEIFGNARTGQNDNSSRFGMYISLLYGKEGVLTAAQTETFLLERTRVVSAPPHEKNYHIFYLLLQSSMAKDEKWGLKLSSAKYFKILQCDDQTANRALGDKNFDKLVASLLDLGCSEVELTYLWRILAAILHLGNIEISKAVGDQTPLRLSFSTTTMAHVSELLGVDADELSKSLSTHVISTKLAMKSASFYLQYLGPTECLNNTFGLMKALYASAFQWIATKVNSSLLGSETRKRSLKSIGILDICGFEISNDGNSFEQLCINFVNERLQQYFNESFFSNEQALYVSEGLTWSMISYNDNQNIIDLIGKKPSGILAILDEHSLLKKNDDMAVLQQLNNTLSDKAYVKSRYGQDPLFSIRHFAGQVTYDINGFLHKNSDAMQEDLASLIAQSSNPLLFCLNPKEQTNRPKDNSPRDTLIAPIRSTATTMASSLSVSSSVRSQIDVLLTKLRETVPHFVKCIKPNDIKSSEHFEFNLVSNQLRYSDLTGILELSKTQFHSKLKFSEFYSKYEALALLSSLKNSKRASHCSELEALSYCKIITDMFPCVDSSLPQLQYGRNYIFLRDVVTEYLQEALERACNLCVTRIQRIARGFLQRRKHKAELNHRKLLAQTTIVQKTVDAVSERASAISDGSPNSKISTPASSPSKLLVESNQLPTKVKQNVASTQPMHAPSNKPPLRRHSETPGASHNLHINVPHSSFLSTDSSASDSRPQPPIKVDRSNTYSPDTDSPKSTESQPVSSSWRALFGFSESKAQSQRSKSDEKGRERRRTSSTVKPQSPRSSPDGQLEDEIKKQLLARYLEEERFKKSFL